VDISKKETRNQLIYLKILTYVDKF